jgi:hypothetical protein
VDNDPSQTIDITDPATVIFFLAALCAVYAGAGLLSFVRRVDERSARGKSTSISDASVTLMALAVSLILAGGGYVLHLFVFRH